MLRSEGMHPRARFRIDVLDATARRYSKRSEVNTAKWGDATYRQLWAFAWDVPPEAPVPKARSLRCESL